MSGFAVPPTAVPACAEPPEGDGWLHEVKHDGHRLLAMIAGGELKLVTYSGYDRTALFWLPFEKLLTAEPPSPERDG